MPENKNKLRIMLRLILRVRIKFLKNRKILKEAFGVVSTGGGAFLFCIFSKGLCSSPTVVGTKLVVFHLLLGTGGERRLKSFGVANFKIEKFRQN